MSPKSFNKNNIYSSLEYYTDFLFLWGHFCNIFRDYLFTSISLYRNRSSFLTQIIAFMKPKNKKFESIKDFRHVKTNNL